MIKWINQSQQIEVLLKLAMNKDKETLFISSFNFFHSKLEDLKIN